MTSMQFVIQPLPATDDQFIERLREVSDKVNKYGFGTHRIFEQLKIPVKEIVIGPSHIGVLLEDGKAFRVAFSINSERLDLSKADATKSSTNNSSNAAGTSKHSSVLSSRQLARSRARLMRTTARSGTSGQGSGSRSSGVIIGGTSSSRPLVSVPSTYVPDELVSQAEVVLQGKSRNLIIRELQRTNLDVNLAVNNLLSRDDEEAEDTEEGGDNYVPEDLISLLDNGFHADNSSVIIDPSDGLFSEEIFSNYSSIRNERNQSNAGGSGGGSSSSADASQPRSSTSANVQTGTSGASAQISAVTADREAFSRWRDRQYYGPRRWLNKDDYAWDKDADAKKKEPAALNSPIWISEELQPWPERGQALRFKKIGALYSEFIGLSETGELHQWRWSDAEPYKAETDNIFHPKTLSLNLNEKVEQLSANFIRCSVVTEHNRVATWMDEHLGYLGAKLEHAAIAFTEFAMDPITTINACSLYTAVRTENNNVYWWGVLPFDQRRYLWDKFRTKTKKPIKPVASDIAVGTQVVMKKCPIYQTGSIGFTCVNGVPKVGQLLNSVWDFNDVCRFKLLHVHAVVSSEKLQAACGTTPAAPNETKETKPVVPLSLSALPTAGGSSSSSKTHSANKETTDRIDMPPPPSPASSTCSDTGSVTSHKRTKRMAAKDDSDGGGASGSGKKDEEMWQLKDVVFVEDKIGPIGKVLKVDGDFVAVRFPAPTVVAAATTAAGSSNSVDGAKEDDWQQCRLLRREDVQIYKTAMTSRGPDWLQKQPKKINIHNSNDAHGFQLLALSVDTKGIHVIKKVGAKMHYSLYNLYNSKQEQNCQFPTDSGAFMGLSPSNIAMFCNNDSSGNNSTIILRDGNRALYPVAKDCVGSIKDPQWFDLPPVKAVAMTTISLPAMGSNLKSKVCMTGLLFEPQQMMPLILRCDLKNAFAALARFDKEERNDVLSIISERCDGGRNIYHACTVMCSPTSNKEPDDKKAATTPRSTAGAAFSSSSSSTNADNATGASTSSSTFASVSTAGVRESRALSLREMMNRLINTDANAAAAEQGGANAAEDMYLPPWAGDSTTAGATAASTNDTVMAGTEDDISKIIAATSSAVAAAAATTSKISTPIYTFDPLQRREHAALILQQMCVSSALRPYLHQMLSAKDAQGQTPFMLAVYSRAYEAGIILLNAILSLSEKESSALKDSMIFPAGSPPDQSPLHVICYNDTCSFTWTGADHINQNIFECKTCGLTGTLCCCTECARVCHKGHDCKIKHTSPTAYCDCWEKCKCKALIAGNQNKRFLLLCKLAACTDLVTKFNAKGESILLFLIQTVGRQTAEQRQYRANARVRNVSGSGGAGGGGASSSSRKAPMDVDTDMPDHDLEPPKFARKALERLLIDWHAVKAMIMTGAESKSDAPQSSTDGAAGNSEPHNVYLQTQNGSTLLDKFTHNLFVKCSSEHLDTLLKTLVREMQNDAVAERIREAEEVARRFVRSVARVFVIFNLEKQPNPDKRKPNLAPHKHIQSSVKVFQTLHKIAVQELCEVADALIAPVRLGVVRPTAPFAMSSSNIDNSDELFNVEPLAPTTLETLSEPATVAHEDGNEQVVAFNIQSNYRLEGNDMETMRDNSEQDEPTHRDGNAQAHGEDVSDNPRNDEGIQDDESDNDFTFNDAETESDSDDNQSTQDAQRSVQTGATLGSETDIGVMFLEDESGDSSPQEEEGSEDGETDDHSDEFNFADHQLERRNTNTSARSDLAPQSMQWAIRNRDPARSSVRVSTGSSLVFIDPMALRRSTVPPSSAVAAPSQEQHTMATTASNLARAFAIIVRQISELLSHASYSVNNDIETSLKLTVEDAVEIQDYVETRLKSTWTWMFSVMDGTEAQLKFGAYLTNYTDPAHPLHPLNLSAQGNNGSGSSTNTSSAQPTTASTAVGINLLGPSSRREFFTYCLSLMRAHTSEHRDSLPVLDITALRHIAYVLDGFVYYMRNDTLFFERTETTTSDVSSASTAAAVATVAAAVAAASAANENEDTDDELSSITNDDAYVDHTSSTAAVAAAVAAASAATTSASALLSATVTSAKRHSFFTRSESTLSLGCLAPDGFDLPLDVALPLADKPHLLQPNSKREDLFANLPLPITTATGAQSMNVLDFPPSKLGFSEYNSTNTVQPIATTLVEKPSTSAATSTAEKNDDNDSYANLYIQLKKKKYSDDVSPKKEGAVEVSAKHFAEDVKMETDAADSAVVVTRPEVIITPSKILRTSFEAAENLSFNAAGTSIATARSVIVRAGTSTSSSTSKKQDEQSSSANSSSTSSPSNRNAAADGAKKFRISSGVAFPARGHLFCQHLSTESPSWNFLLGRWKLTLDLFGRVFMDDVGMEQGSVLPELRGFPVKEMRFRRHMEKLRNGQQRDLILCKLERNRDSLIIQTFKELNAQFGTQNRRVHPPLMFNRVKVTFKDEPGEGSGVARSFYTSISEALLASAKMPNLESVQVGNNCKYGVPFSSILRNRGASGRDPPTLQRRGTGSKILWRTSRERKVLNYDARPYTPTAGNADNNADNANEHLSVHLQQLGERLHPKIYSINPANAAKITGMLLEIPTPQLLSILSSEETLRQKVNEALDLIMYKQKSETGNSAQSKKMIPVVLLEQCQVEDNDPLFYSPGKRGFYTPRQGYGSFERINAFRNIGRLIGMCLLQNELLPLFLQRHVLKYVLGRKIKFHDLAFFDPALYESFRQLIQNAQTEEGDEIITKMELFFVIDLMKEEGGGSIELIPGGREAQVTSSNLFDYIRRYTEYRLIKSQEKALEALKDGVFDVLPDSSMDSLTSEDMRLLLNGVGDINVTTLISYTAFNDESSEGSDKLLKFKRWFWSIVEKMNTLERQDLVYFWTGSPALPASEEGFQPLPSVTIRPADDSHLPTANTCISRLYIPLYSSKSILRSKLLLAIKSKNFGFV